MPRMVGEVKLRDRLDRYDAGEPLKDIAKDHKVTTSAILDTVKRYRPDAIGHRARGPLPSWVTDPNSSLNKKKKKESVSRATTSKKKPVAGSVPAKKRSARSNRT